MQLFIFVLFDRTLISIDYVNSENGADVTKNDILISNIISSSNSNLSSEIINADKTGAPVIKFGDGENDQLHLLLHVLMEINYLPK